MNCKCNLRIRYIHTSTFFMNYYLRRYIMQNIFLHNHLSAMYGISLLNLLIFTTNLRHS